MKYLKSSGRAAVSWMLSAALVIAQTPAPPAQSGSEQPTIRVTTRLIQLNVVAQDHHGNPITDLTKDDFVLKDAGKEQKISVFAMERSDVTPATPVGGHVVAGQTLPPGTFTNRVDRRAGAVTVILFDMINLVDSDRLENWKALDKATPQRRPAL